MPEPAAFLAGFGVSSGTHLLNGFISQASSQHYRVASGEYAYATTLIIVNVTSPQNLLQELHTQVSASRIIRSNYGNNYLCVFGNPVIQSVTPSSTGYTVVLTAEGHSWRQ